MICPLCQFVGTRRELQFYLFYAEHYSRIIPGYQPLPECGTEIETVVQVFRLDEDVGIEQIGHSEHPQTAPEFVEGRQFGKTEELERIPVKCQSRECAGHESPREALADSRSLCEIEVSSGRAIE